MTVIAVTHHQAYVCVFAVICWKGDAGDGICGERLKTTSQGSLMTTGSLESRCCALGTNQGGSNQSEINIDSE